MVPRGSLMIEPKDKYMVLSVAVIGQSLGLESAIVGLKSPYQKENVHCS